MKPTRYKNTKTGLGDHVEQTRWLVLQKARRHPAPISSTILPSLRNESETASPFTSTKTQNYSKNWCGAPTLRQRHGFRNYFISLTGMLFTFPSRYSFTIDLEQYLALEVSAPGFRRGFSGPALLEDICIACLFLSRTRLSLSVVGLSRTIPLEKTCATPFNRVHIPRNPQHLIEEVIDFQK